MGNSVTFNLGWPHPYLWPNGGTEWHRMAVWRVKKAAKEEANWSVRIAKDRDWKPDPEARFDIHIIGNYKKGGVAPDKDNLIAGLKASFDGMAEGLGVNDRQFNLPTVEWAEPVKNGKLKVTITQC